MLSFYYAILWCHYSSNSVSMFLIWSQIRGPIQSFFLSIFANPESNIKSFPTFTHLCQSRNPSWIEYVSSCLLQLVDFTTSVVQLVDFTTTVGSHPPKLSDFNSRTYLHPRSHGSLLSFSNIAIQSLLHAQFSSSLPKPSLLHLNAFGVLSKASCSSVHGFITTTSILFLL